MFPSADGAVDHAPLFERSNVPIETDLEVTPDTAGSAVALSDLTHEPSICHWSITMRSASPRDVRL